MQHSAATAKLDQPVPGDTSIHPHRDPNTLSNYNAWRTHHVKAELAIDFDAKKVAGKVSLDMKKQHEKADEIVLDTSYLDIKDVHINGSKAEFDVASSRIELHGSPLTIKVPSGVGEDITVEITTSTTKDCTALQWLTAGQTPNKKHPYMFSQCQAIHARSFIPCQDTPDVKATYDFIITSPLPVLASGIPEGSSDAASSPGQKTYNFRQPIPMPSYLFAIASGDVVGAKIGPRSHAFSGPDEIAAVKWEFEEDMEHFIQVAEKIVFPYPWGPYNVLVLPNSFPYGGMENCCCSFLTPTLISGDRQNVDVVAHELSHSWSGNLVSNASWEHFWLNEGWTVYLERRIVAALHGEAHRDFSAIIGWKALSDSIAHFGADHEFTKMITDLKGKDPDDAFSSIPYEKGFVFLYYLEKLIGQDKWDKFIPHYFRKYERKSLDSYEFKATLLDFFSSDNEASKKLSELDWDKWLYSPGFPVEKPKFDTSLADGCYALAEKWEKLNTGSDSDWEPKKSDLDGWVANQSVVFLEKVQTFDKPLSPELVEKMGSTYSFATSQNVELVSRYFVIGLKAKAKSVFQPAAELVGKVGRMKFVRPLYRGLKAGDEKLAKETFQKHKDFYHPICRAMVEKDLYGSK